MKPTKGAAYVAKTEAMFSALVAKYQNAESVTGKLTRETNAKRSIEENAMVRVMLFKENDGSKDEETPVNIKLSPGTSSTQTLETTTRIRQTGKKLKQRFDLTKFWAGDLEVRANSFSVKWLKEDVFNRMPKRKDEATKEDFRDVADFFKTNNAIFA
jgi:hypothetical protein